MKKILTFLTIVITLQACKDKTKKQGTIEQIKATEHKLKTVRASNNIEDTENKNEETVYPKTGDKATDFLPKSDVYEIQYETEGDLNLDGLQDIVIVLKRKDGKTSDRPMLVLLKNKIDTYRLDKISDIVMPEEYTENDFQKYSSEDISIDNGVLKIQLYGSGGPIGNIFSHFKYFGNDLVLNYIKTYNAGAGSWQNLYYDLEKAELTEKITNTMKDDMPSESKTFKLEKEKKHLFETTSPDEVIADAYKKIDSNW